VRSPCIEFIALTLYVEFSFVHYLNFSTFLSFPFLSSPRRYSISSCTSRVVFLSIRLTLSYSYSSMFFPVSDFAHLTNVWSMVGGGKFLISKAR